MKLTRRFFIKNAETLIGLAVGEYLRETPTKVVLEIKEVYVLKDGGVFTNIKTDPDNSVTVHVSKKTGNINFSSLNSHIKNVLNSLDLDSYAVSSSMCFAHNSMDDDLIYIYTSNLKEDAFFTQKKTKEILDSAAQFEEVATSAAGVKDWVVSITSLRNILLNFPNMIDTEKEKFENNLVFTVALSESCKRVSTSNSSLIRSFVKVANTADKDYSMDLKKLLKIKYFISSGFCKVEVRDDIKIRLSTVNVDVIVTDRWKGKEYIVSLKVYNENRMFEPTFIKDICAVRDYGISFFASTEVHPTMLPYIYKALEKARDIHNEKFGNAEIIMWR